MIARQRWRLSWHSHLKTSRTTERLINRDRTLPFGRPLKIGRLPHRPLANIPDQHRHDVAHVHCESECSSRLAEHVGRVEEVENDIPAVAVEAANRALLHVDLIELQARPRGLAEDSLCLLYTSPSPRDS